MQEKLEEIKASENMMKFFKRLLDLKTYVKDLLQGKCDNRHVGEIHDRLNEIIKDANEEKK